MSKKHKGCYFSENSMNPQCHALWDRMEEAEARVKEYEAKLAGARAQATERLEWAEKAEAKRDRLAALLEGMQVTISDWLPSLRAVHEGEYNEHTGKVLLAEDQWTGISEAEIALRTILEKQ